MSLWRKRQIMEKQSEHNEVCESCGGFGDHGIEEESGMPYTCYACCGVGTVKILESLEDKCLIVKH